ncbi:unnamed protein product [Trifolium pratense]|uniref:Uncharacterized protein n=1 Tax=Trifolium pratense TaxID=57577 RepID=A0ACB0KN68_TRIPR|nr:unnamed protein product [Trifolium pratense]
MQQCVCGEAEKLGFIAVVVKSDNGGSYRKAYVLLCCSRGGDHKVYINKKEEDTTTLKCECMFRLKSYLLNCGQWSLNVVDGTHNHKPKKATSSLMNSFLKVIVATCK